MNNQLEIPFYFINQQTEINNSSKEEEKDSNNSYNYNKNQSSSENNNFAHIYKNGDVIKMVSLDVNSSIYSLKHY